MRRRKLIALLAILVGSVCLGISGCGEGYQSPTQRPECIEGESECPGGQVCLGSRCYDRCSVDTDCSRWERCADGVCLGSSVPQDDGGTVPDGDSDTDVDGDSDTDTDGDHDGDTDTDTDTDTDADTDTDLDPDPDLDADPDTVEGCTDCPPGTPYCHGLADVCVECDGFGQCLMQPVCNIARGTCVDFASGQCAPCEPAHGMCGGGLACVDRRPVNWETVCLTRCDSGCPTGTVCSPDGTYCIPSSGVSCTAWFSCSRGRSCATRSDCGPLGDSGAGVECSGSGACGLLCGDGSECPEGRSCGAETLCL
jgi:hypothetical protein